MTNPADQTLILGGGFAGLYTALHLSHQHYPRPVALIDREERFCFKPLLYEYCSGEMSAEQVWPPFKELLQGSGTTFVQDAVQSIDLHQREVKLASGASYNYSNLVLALGSVDTYLGVEGAKEHALSLRLGEDAIAIDKRLRECLQQARETDDPEQRRRLLTVAVVGGGPSGIEIACTLADLLPNWFQALGGNPHEVRVVLINHGRELLQDDVNSRVRETAQQALLRRTVLVELILGAKATAVRPHQVEYQCDGKTEILPACTTIWTAGTGINPLIKDLPIPAEQRDKRGRLLVTPTMQLLDFPEVFVGGDCAAVKDNYLPATAQVAYQQGNAIAYNLNALALGKELKPAKVSSRGTLLKLGMEESVANIYDRFEVTGDVGHLIRQATYLELLPTPIHDFKATAEWFSEDTFKRHLPPDQAKEVIKWVGGAVVGAAVAGKLLQALGDDKKDKS